MCDRTIRGLAEWGYIVGPVAERVYMNSLYTDLVGAIVDGEKTGIIRAVWIANGQLIALVVTSDGTMYTSTAHRLILAKPY